MILNPENLDFFWNTCRIYLPSLPSVKDSDLNSFCVANKIFFENNIETIGCREPDLFIIGLFENLHILKNLVVSQFDKIINHIPHYLNKIYSSETVLHQSESQGTPIYFRRSSIYHSFFKDKVTPRDKNIIFSHTRRALL